MMDLAVEVCDHEYKTLRPSFIHFEHLFTKESVVFVFLISI